MNRVITKAMCRRLGQILKSAAKCQRRLDRDVSEIRSIIGESDEPGGLAFDAGFVKPMTAAELIKRANIQVQG